MFWRTASAICMLLILLTFSFITSEAIAEENTEETFAGEYPVEVVRIYSREAREFTEGIAVDQNTGAIYVSITDKGQIWEQPADGSEPFVVTSFGEDRPMGMAVDRFGDIYVALRSYNPYTQGVYRVSVEDGSYERLPFTEAIFHPNAMAFDKKGNLYVTDSILGAIWRIPPNGDDAELWLHHPLLKGVNYPTVFHNYHIGANGIIYARRGFYVTNSEQGSIVHVRIKKNGKAAEPKIVVQDTEELTIIDGIALDKEGKIYVCHMDLGLHRVVRIDPRDGSITTLATHEDGLDYATSIAFGRGEYRESVFVVNYAAYPGVGDAGPGVLRIDVGVPGKRLTD